MSGLINTNDFEAGFGFSVIKERLKLSLAELDQIIQSWNLTFTNGDYFSYFFVKYGKKMFPHLVHIALWNHIVNGCHGNKYGQTNLNIQSFQMNMIDLAHIQEIRKHIWNDTPAQQGGNILIKITAYFPSNHYLNQCRQIMKYHRILSIRNPASVQAHIIEIPFKLPSDRSSHSWSIYIYIYKLKSKDDLFLGWSYVTHKAER